jgi:uncharacterized membrane protein YfcA
MSQTVVLTAGLFVLAMASGMLGLGVAFAAVPFLGLFLPDLVHQVQPLSLVLNGLTGLASTLGFARSGYVEWRRAGILAVVTTAFAPLGALAAQYVPQFYIWLVYFASVLYLAWRLFRPVAPRPGAENYRAALLLAAPISILSGLLGVGPGFLLLPTLILVGFEPKKAAGMNALAITPPSFSALIPHLGTARVSVSLAVPLVIAGVIGSFAGARITSVYVPSGRLKQLFGILTVVMTLYKLYTLVG